MGRLTKRKRWRERGWSGEASDTRNEQELFPPDLAAAVAGELIKLKIEMARQERVECNTLHGVEYSRWEQLLVRAVSFLGSVSQDLFDEYVSVTNPAVGYERRYRIVQSLRQLAAFSIRWIIAHEKAYPGDVVR